MRRIKVFRGATRDVEDQVNVFLQSEKVGKITEFKAFEVAELLTITILYEEKARVR